MLHFYILDCLRKSPDQTADAITDRLLEGYGRMFDSQIVRRKCNQYATEGILTKEKRGKEVLYRLSPPFQKLLAAHPGLKNAIKLYQLSSPLGIVGNTIMDTVSFHNDLFRIKHNFFVHTLEDEVLLSILQAMHAHRTVFLNLKSTKSERLLETEGVPLKIFTSTRTGRRYLCLYLPDKKRFTNIRMDAVKSVKTEELYPEYEAIREQLERNKESAWGVSFQNDNRHHSERVKLTLHIDEHSEQYILNRLQREGKGGVIRQTAPDTFTYEAEVFDANEMLPWIRTFIGRILSVESTSPQLAQRFQRDFLTMYHMYFGESC